MIDREYVHGEPVSAEAMPDAVRGHGAELEAALAEPACDPCGRQSANVDQQVRVLGDQWPVHVVCRCVHDDHLRTGEHPAIGMVDRQLEEQWPHLGARSSERR